MLLNPFSANLHSTTVPVGQCWNGMLYQAPKDDASEGAAFIWNHIINVTKQDFDDFAKSQPDEVVNNCILGL